MNVEEAVRSCVRFRPLPWRGGHDTTLGDNREFERVKRERKTLVSVTLTKLDAWKEVAMALAWCRIRLLQVLDTVFIDWLRVRDFCWWQIVHDPL